MSKVQEIKQRHILHSSQKSKFTISNFLLQYKTFITFRTQEA